MKERYGRFPSMKLLPESLSGSYSFGGVDSGVNNRRLIGSVKMVGLYVHSVSGVFITPPVTLQRESGEYFFSRDIIIVDQRGEQTTIQLFSDRSGNLLINESPEAKKLADDLVVKNRVNIRKDIIKTLGLSEDKEDENPAH